MLREIGLATPLLIILTVVVIFAALSQTTGFGPLAGGVGVSEEQALSWGQVLEPAAEATPEATEAVIVDETETPEVTEEATEAMTPEADETEEASE